MTSTASAVRHRWGWPWVQKKHVRHWGTHEITTWSPGTRSSTPSPTSSTTPAPSWPSTAGRVMGRVPFCMERSEWQTPEATMRTRTSPGWGCSTSTPSRM